MRLHERIKSIREDRSIPQETVASGLGMSQSQYSRRESGEVSFLAKEISTIAKILGVKIWEIYGEGAIIFNNNNQQGGTFGKFTNFYQYPEKLLEQIDKCLKAKDDIIRMLKEEVNEYRKAKK